MCSDVSMLYFQLNHVDKRGPRYCLKHYVSCAYTRKSFFKHPITFFSRFIKHVIIQLVECLCTLKKVYEHLFNETVLNTYRLWTHQIPYVLKWVRFKGVKVDSFGTSFRLSLLIAEKMNAYQAKYMR